MQILVNKRCKIHVKCIRKYPNSHTTNRNILYYFKLLFNIVLLFITIVLLFILKADFLENVNTCYECTMRKKSPAQAIYA